ncbi:MAG: homoserine dehydrogenase [Fusobacteriaceae bacterium]|nr:homoserine dehydrogenase [Fusobacteriaceae bacterium]
MKIGIIGLGTVGLGVLEILVNESKNLKAKGADIEIKYACDLDHDKVFPNNFDKTTLIKNYETILNDPDVDTIVELIGGDNLAKKIILEAIDKGKNVITANKALIAKHPKEIFSRAIEKDVNLFYEASVGGGIPIIAPLLENLVANNILGIRGIINGTCNYILSEMSHNDLEFDTVLNDAMEKGYAEADPSFDIEGIDAAHKICILASLAFNKTVDVKKILTNGITKIKLSDLKLAESLGYSIKLIAAASQNNNSISISVEPTLVNKKDLLSNVEGVFNAVEVEGDYVGKTLFYGRGAGKEATASAVVADIVKAALKCTYKDRHYFNIEEDAILLGENEFSGKYYVRVGKTFPELEKISYQIEQIAEEYIYFTNTIKLKELKNILGNEEYSLLRIN